MLTTVGEITVHNKKLEPMRQGDVYVGRGSPWGNPFNGSGKPSMYSPMAVPTVEESVERYAGYIQDLLYRSRSHQVAMDKLRWMHETGNLRLFCFCVDRDGNGPCHAKILEAIIRTWVTP